jgi:hypothetical protein
MCRRYRSQNSKCDAKLDKIIRGVVPGHENELCTGRRIVAPPRGGILKSWGRNA